MSANINPTQQIYDNNIAIVNKSLSSRGNVGEILPRSANTSSLDILTRTDHFWLVRVFEQDRIAKVTYVKRDRKKKRTTRLQSEALRSLYLLRSRGRTYSTLELITKRYRLSTLLTCTYEENPDDWETVRDHHLRFNRAVRRAVGHIPRVGVEGISESGRWHLHVAIPGDLSPDKLERIRRLWRRGSTHVSYRDPEEDELTTCARRAAYLSGNIPHDAIPDKYPRYLAPRMGVVEPTHVRVFDDYKEATRWANNLMGGLADPFESWSSDPSNNWTGPPSHIHRYPPVHRITWTPMMN